MIQQSGALDFAGSPPQSQHAELPPLETTTAAEGLAGKIEAACEEFADVQWIVHRMLKYLRQIGFPMKAKPEGRSLPQWEN